MRKPRNKPILRGSHESGCHNVSSVNTRQGVKEVLVDLNVKAC